MLSTGGIAGCGWAVDEKVHLGYHGLLAQEMVPNIES